MAPSSSNAAAGRFFIPLLLMVLIHLGSLSMSVSGRPVKTLTVSSYSFFFRREPASGPSSEVNNPPVSGSSSSYSGFVTIFTATLPAVELNPGPAASQVIRTGSNETQQQDGYGYDYQPDFTDIVASYFATGLFCLGMLATVVSIVSEAISGCAEELQLQELSNDEYDSYTIRPEKKDYVKIPAQDPSSPVPSRA